MKIAGVERLFVAIVVLGIVNFVYGMWFATAPLAQGFWTFVGGCLIALGIALHLNRRL